MPGGKTRRTAFLTAAVQTARLRSYNAGRPGYTVTFAAGWIWARVALGSKTVPFGQVTVGFARGRIIGESRLYFLSKAAERGGRGWEAGLDCISSGVLWVALRGW